MNGRTLAAGKTNGSMRQFNEVAHAVPKSTAGQMNNAGTQGKYQVASGNATGTKMESRRVVQTGGQTGNQMGASGGQQKQMLNMTSDERAMKMQANSTAGHMTAKGGSTRAALMTSLSMVSWAEGWLQEVETSNFMPVTFRYCYVDGTLQKFIRCCVMFAKRQSMLHGIESKASYELETGSDNKRKIENARSIHFPNRDDETEKNQVYEDMQSAAMGSPSYVNGSAKWIHSSKLVPQAVVANNVEVGGDGGATKIGVKFHGFDSRCYTRKVADTGSYDKSDPEGSSYSMIANKKGSSNPDVIFSYYPPDATAHVETMYGPVDDAYQYVNAENVKMGNPVFVYMLCEFNKLWDKYAKRFRDDFSQHEHVLDGALKVFFRSYGNVCVSFNDFQSRYDEEYLTKLLELIVDTSNKVNVDNKPDWNISHSGGEDTLKVPAGFARILVDAYTEDRKIVNFDPSKFEVAVTPLGSGREGTVSFDLEVECFRPNCFVYKTYLQ